MHLFLIFSLRTEMIAAGRLYRRLVNLGVALLIGSVGAISVCQPSTAAPPSAVEQEVPANKIKAAFLYNFFLFVNWPSLPERAVTIGILGKDPFGKSFLEVENQLVKGLNKQLSIKRLGPYTPEMDLTQCQILFISSSEKENWEKISLQLAGKPVLTVGDQKGFLEAGGMMNFLLVQNKIRWEINRSPLNQSGLRMDSQLLESAVRILPN
jgi:hypothetical protein